MNLTTLDRDANAFSGVVKHEWHSDSSTVPFFHGTQTRTRVMLAVEGSNPNTTTFESLIAAYPTCFFGSPIMITIGEFNPEHASPAMELFCAPRTEAFQKASLEG